MASLSPNIGKIAGITIQLHWTFLALILFAFVLLVATAQGLFLFALIVLLFVCVLFHELAHSIVSQRNGIKVKKIILLPIGGASIINMDKAKPAVELKIAISGPLASIAIGIICVILSIYAPAGYLQQGLYFLFEINILLGLFNLLPGFPLDGGRVLRSYLQRKHSFMQSTVLAARVSNVVVVALIVGTVIYAALLPGATFIYREFIVFWDIIIALFLYDGAKAELQAAKVKGYTDKMTAGDMLSENYILVKQDMMVRDLYSAMLKKGTRVVLLQRGRKIMGINDKQLSKLAENPGTITAKEAAYFTVSVPQVSCKESLSHVIETMRNEELNTIIATKNKKVAGILYAPYMDAALQMYLTHAAGKKTSREDK
jgi:Zn-dependent protease